MTFLLICLAFSALLIIFRNKVAYIFNSDPEVVLEVGKVTIYVAAFQVRTTSVAKIP